MLPSGIAFYKNRREASLRLSLPRMGKGDRASGARVLSYIAYLRRSPSLSFIPPVPYSSFEQSFYPQSKGGTPPRLTPEPWTRSTLNAIYPFISIARHAFLIIIYFSNLEYFRWIYLRRHAGDHICKYIALYDLINSRLCKFRDSINSYVNAKRKWKWDDGTRHFNS